MEAAGIIGLGIMGGAMARNLRAAGWRVLGYDPDQARAAALADAGVEALDSAEAVARAAPVLMTSLPSAAALHATAAAIAGAGVERRVVVEASTMTLEDKLAFEATLRQAGHAALDCPISGTGAQAQDQGPGRSTPAATAPQSRGCARSSTASPGPRTTSAPTATAAA